jgi:hypothetical protein
MTTPLLPEAFTEAARLNLPAALPDQRTAARLLGIVDQFSQVLKRLQAEPVASPQSARELLALQTENALLKVRQNAAKEQLVELLKKIQAAPPAVNP